MILNTQEIKPTWEELSPHEACSLFEFKWQHELVDIKKCLHAIKRMRYNMWLSGFFTGIATYIILQICNAYFFDYSLESELYVFLIGVVGVAFGSYGVHIIWFREAVGRFNVIQLYIQLSPDMIHDYKAITKKYVFHKNNEILYPLTKLLKIINKYNKTLLQ